MIIEKLMMPYLIASLHPIIHTTQLVFNIYIWIYYNENVSKPVKKSMKFMITSHILCIFFHLAAKVARIRQYLKV